MKFNAKVKVAKKPVRVVKVAKKPVAVKKTAKKLVLENIMKRLQKINLYMVEELNN